MNTSPIIKSQPGLTALGKALLLSGCMAMVLGLSACSKDVKEAHKPSPLPKLAQVEKLTPVFKESIASGEKNDPLRLQLDADANAIYAVSRDGYVVAYTPQGKTLWKERPAKKEKDISSGVSAGQGLVVVGSATGKLYALDAATGQLKWQRQLSGSILAPSLIDGDRVITLCNDGTAYGTDLATGEPAWVFDTPAASLSVRGTAAPVLADDDTVVLASASAYVYGLDARSGVPKWQRRVAISEGRSEVQRLIDVDGDPVVVDNYLYTVSYQGQLTAVDLSTQKVVWTQDTSSLRGAVVANGLVYVATAEGQIQAYNQVTGEPAWKQEGLAYRGLSNPVLFGRYVAVGDEDGYIHLLDPNSGNIVGRVKSSGEVRSMRVINDRLYVATRTGHLSVWQAS